MKYYYKRNLPHIIVDGSAYFVTTRLAGSLPQSVIDTLKTCYQSRVKDITTGKIKKAEKEELARLQWQYFTEFDNKLETYSQTPAHLANEEIAEELKEALHYRDNKYYNLIAYVIMSNHLHLAFIPNMQKLLSDSGYKEKYPLGGLLGSLKRYTARRANKILHKQGDFWQHENYDHIIRDGKELKKIVQYILNNPVKAGLVNNAENYKWSYYNPEYM